MPTPNTHQKFSNQNGMTLIEMAIAILIVGVMLGGALQLYAQNKDQYATKITNERMQTIYSALATFAEANNRIPCPADPSIVTARVAVTPPVGREPWRWGLERGLVGSAAPSSTSRPGDATIANIGNCNGAGQTSGIVPFQTLNIPASTIKDGWGNYFTYGVSPVFTQRTDFSGGTTEDQTHLVHEQCRTVGWILGTVNGTLTGQNINPPKARFCCAWDAGNATTSDLIINNRDNSQTVSPTRVTTNYLALNQITRVGAAGTNLRNAAGNIEAPAFVLISHGKNGAGSFLANDTANRKTGGSAPEAENTDGNRTYALGTSVTNFDDIIVWGTQYNLMSYHGTSSCSLP